MTFDDGIVRIYELKNVADNGDKPKYKLSPKESFYFGFDVLGLTRYYTALSAKTELAHVINVPGWGSISPQDIAVMEDGAQYRIPFIQPVLDDNNLRITRLSLERILEDYDFAGETCDCS